MIYEVKKGDITLQIDDNVFFDKQPKEFKNILESTMEGGIAAFDNCSVTLLENGRIIITLKDIE